jgi:hypothetical protein
MTQIAEEAFQALRRLPEEEQESLALAMLEMIEEEARWDRLLADPRPEGLLIELAAGTEREVADGHIRGCDCDAPDRSGKR